MCHSFCLTPTKKPRKMKSGLLNHSSDYHGSCNNVKIALDEPVISKLQHSNSDVSLWKSQLPHKPKCVSYCEMIGCGNIICIFIGLLIISITTHSVYSSWLWTKLLINHNYRYYHSCNYNHDIDASHDTCDYCYTEYNLHLYFFILKCSYLGYPWIMIIIVGSFFTITTTDQPPRSMSTRNVLIILNLIGLIYYYCYYF